MRDWVRTILNMSESAFERLSMNGYGYESVRVGVGTNTSESEYGRVWVSESGTDNSSRML